MSSRQRIDASPLADDHITEGLGCWCVPRYLLPCDECGNMESLEEIAERHGVERVHANAGDVQIPEVPSCWKCTHGLIELTRADAEARDRPIIIVHNA